MTCRRCRKMMSTEEQLKKDFAGLAFVIGLLVLIIVVPQGVQKMTTVAGDVLVMLKEVLADANDG